MYKRICEHIVKRYDTYAAAAFLAGAASSRLWWCVRSARGLAGLTGTLPEEVSSKLKQEARKAFESMKEHAGPLGYGPESFLLDSISPGLDSTWAERSTLERLEQAVTKQIEELERGFQPEATDNNEPNTPRP